MNDEIELPDELSDYRREVQQRAEAHERVRETEPYIDQIVRLDGLVTAFAGAVQACSLAVTRWDGFGERSFLVRNLDDLVEAVIMSAEAMRHGAMSAARREMRHILEVVVSSAFVDESMGNGDFEARVKFFNSGRVNKTNVEQVAKLQLRMLGSERERFASEAKRLWVNASHYVHPTKKRLDEKLALRAAGIRLGFENAGMLETSVGELHGVLSIALVLLLETIGPQFTADLFVGGYDSLDAWPFHASPFIAAVDASFDYKAERQSALSQHVARRARRLDSERGA